MLPNNESLFINILIITITLKTKIIKFKRENLSGAKTPHIGVSVNESKNFGSLRKFERPLSTPGQDLHQQNHNTPLQPSSLRVDNIL